ncbi:MAG TPA: anhydro-N-acetylmuramic acid kinase [Gemmatimonadaceae bacterium]|nr:anhydro-N-acetylmuramic acid kinase [Gemmatimonadaceae bacterium]
MSRQEAYIGLMSGTSLDGISACLVRFSEPGSIQEARDTSQGAALDFELLAFSVLEYTQEQRDRLLAAMQKGSAQEYCRLEFDLGAWLATAANAVLAESGVPRDQVRAIGSHGQTLWHEAPHSTWQIGEPAVIAERVGIDVISDFRVADVAAGGQGAPLVPIADSLLFAGNSWRALQNIGGIGNVTVVPPGGELSAMRAFDTGPGVGVLDAVVRTLRPDLRYDRDGELAARGLPVASVLDELLKHPYFLTPPPKSTGRELFNPAYVTSLIEKCRAGRSGCTDEDIIATATALTARSIADAYRRFMPEPVQEVIISGGGAKNETLVDLIEQQVAPKKVRQFDELFMDGEAKEAVAFALLARLFIQRVSGNVPTATGAKGPRILGKLTPGNRVLGRPSRGL